VPFHLLAYTKADTAATSNEDYPGVTDNWAVLNASSHYLLQQDAFLMAAYVQNAGATNARINTPRYRVLGLPSIHPVNRSAAPVTRSPFMWLRPMKLFVPRIDDLALEVSNDGAGAVRGVGGIWVSDGQYGVPSGTNTDVFTIRATGTITATALAWTLGNITFESGLPAGRYGVVGMSAFGTNLVFVRLVFPGGAGPSGMRPGVVANPTTAIFQDDRFRYGNSGLLGTFESTAQPLIEIFSTAANSAQTLWLDLVRLGGPT
jgi:hypothetical protein